MVHDGDPLREAGHDLHVVLDHQHGPPLLAVHGPDHLDEIGQLFGAKPGPFNEWKYQELYAELIAMLRAKGL